MTKTTFTFTPNVSSPSSFYLNSAIGRDLSSMDCSLAFKRTEFEPHEKQTEMDTFMLDEAEHKLIGALTQAYKDEEHKDGTLMVREKPPGLFAGRNILSLIHI